MKSPVYVVGTFDTKKDELLFLKKLIETQGLDVVTLDVSAKFSHSSQAVSPADVAPEEIAQYSPNNLSLTEIFDGDRGRAINNIIPCLEAYIKAHCVSAIIGIGGSGGTALISPSMRALDVGIPKLLVSTVASGNIQPYIGASDITIMYSVADIAGLNQITHKIMFNAAHAIAGMAKANKSATTHKSSKKAVGLSMFGVTTPCVSAITDAIKHNYDPLVFHATGAGGQAMEALAQQKQLCAVIDITTTEIADHLNGGVFSAGESRLDAIVDSSLPYLGSVGALDMINFGAPNTVPEKYRDRLIHKHNPQVTIVRTNVDENIAIGKWIARKLNLCKGPVRFLLPTKGISLISTKGQPFYDPEADEALFSTLHEHFISSHSHQLISLPFAINDSDFSKEVIKHFIEIMNA